MLHSILFFACLLYCIPILLRLFHSVEVPNILQEGVGNVPNSLGGPAWNRSAGVIKYGVLFAEIKEIFFNNFEAVLSVRRKWFIDKLFRGGGRRGTTPPPPPFSKTSLPKYYNKVVLKQQSDNCCSKKVVTISLAVSLQARQ